VVSFNPRPLYSRDKDPSVPDEHEGGRGLRYGRISASAKNQTPVVQPIASHATAGACPAFFMDIKSRINKHAIRKHAGPSACKQI